MANPAAIHITRKPLIRKDRVLKMNRVSGGTPAASCAAAEPATMQTPVPIAAARPILANSLIRFSLATKSSPYARGARPRGAAGRAAKPVPP
jgi:hypothetical protein